MLVKIRIKDNLGYKAELLIRANCLVSTFLKGLLQRNRCEASRGIFISSVLTVNYTAEVFSRHIITCKTSSRSRAHLHTDSNWCHYRCYRHSSPCEAGGARGVPAVAAHELLPTSAHFLLLVNRWM